MNSLDTVINQKLQLVIEELDLTTPSTIPKANFRLNVTTEQIIYQTAYCFVLAKYSSKTPLQLAHQIAQQLDNQNRNSRNNRDFTTNVSGEGWLEFVVDEYIVAKYLNTLAKHPLIVKQPFKEKNDRQIKFSHYYIHARCCSLLTEAHRQQIITIDNLNFSLNRWQIVEPKFKKYQLLYLRDYTQKSSLKNLLFLIEQINQSKIKVDTALNRLQDLFIVLESHNHFFPFFSDERELRIAYLGWIGLILHYHQNLFYTMFQVLLPPKI